MRKILNAVFFPSYQNLFCVISDYGLLIEKLHIYLVLQWSSTLRYLSVHVRI